MIPFNKVHTTGEEINYITQAIHSGKISGNGYYGNACEAFFEKKYDFKRVLLTPSCTDALELAALLLDIKQGDEVIMPSFSFVSMATAFILRGAKIVFADSTTANPNIDPNHVKTLITLRTKAIVVIHYGGVACDIEVLKKIADSHKIYLIEDAAHAIDSFYNSRPLGSFGHMATFSFHETKNITCGEGGLLVINDNKFINRAEVMREKGTNQSSFNRKEIARYNWIDTGSSFLAPDTSAAFLYAQLTQLDDIQGKRKKIWEYYFKGLKPLADKGVIELPNVPANSTHNGHIFYIICKSPQVRTHFIEHMLLNNVQAQFHYITLHDSPFYKKLHGKRALPMAKFYQNCLVRLPIFYDLAETDAEKIIKLTWQFFK